MPEKEVKDNRCRDIWVVVNAGGNSREEEKGEKADKDNAIACRELTERRIMDQADILAKGLYRQVEKLRKGDRIAILQCGYKGYRTKYGSGELVACGRVFEEVRSLTPQDKSKFKVQYELVQKYFPPCKQKNELKWIICYSLRRARQRLPKEEVRIRPMPGNKFILVEQGNPKYNYKLLDEWWNENCYEEEEAKEE